MPQRAAFYRGATHEDYGAPEQTGCQLRVILPDWRRVQEPLSPQRWPGQVGAPDPPMLELLGSWWHHGASFTPPWHHGIIYILAADPAAVLLEALPLQIQCTHSAWGSAGAYWFLQPHCACSHQQYGHWCAQAEHHQQVLHGPALALGLGAGAASLQVQQNWLWALCWDHRGQHLLGCSWGSTLPWLSPNTQSPSPTTETENHWHILFFSAKAWEQSLVFPSVQVKEPICSLSIYNAARPGNALVPSCCSKSELMKSQSHSALDILQSRYAKISSTYWKKPT